MGRGARRRDGERGYGTGLSLGGGLRAGVSGPERFPGFPRGERSGLGPLLPRIPASVPEDKPVAARLCGGCRLPSPFSLLGHGRSQFTRFIAPFSPASAQGSRGTDRSPLEPAPPLPAPPHRPGRSARALARSLALRRGRSPRVVGTTSGQRKAKAAGRGRSVFRAPLSFRRPLGCVVLPLAHWLREEI